MLAAPGPVRYRRSLIRRCGTQVQEAGEITELLSAWSEGDDDALQQLLPRVYGELRSLAGHLFRDRSGSATLQPTALVHEAFLRLEGKALNVNDRSHFLALISKAMRHVLVDHARSKSRQKRGGDFLAVTFHDEIVSDASGNGMVIDVHESIERLHAVDERRAEALELHYFGGLTYDEIATALGISAATVDRQLRLAKAWLLRELSDDHKQ